MKKNSLLFILFIFLQSCLYDYELKPLEPYFIFHDHSSKVWLVDKSLHSNLEIGPNNIQEKEILIFHKNRKCYFYLLNNMAKGAYKIVDFKIDAENKQLVFIEKNKIEKYNLLYYSHDKIEIENKSNEIKKLLISFPEY
ncbi:MAG: hypothetical protein HYU67_02395 [Flavobacteriia bacterium]|nr:hypothetical protein [Flavobacteriia bacterium]